MRIGHASISERGTIVGTAGDQNGREVKISDWYHHSKGWVILRCVDPVKREKIAQAMEKACKNNDIGYDQNQRDTLFNNVKTKGFDPSKTTKRVETDCSALVRVCIAYAYGKDIAGNIRTVSLPGMLVKTGQFTKITEPDYTRRSTYLRRGDILCTPVSGHTVIVLDNGSGVKSGNTKPVKTSTKYYRAPSRNYDSIVDALKNIKVKSTYSNRCKIAKKNGIKNYSGKASQNNKMLDLLYKGKLLKI